MGSAETPALRPFRFSLCVLVGWPSRLQGPRNANIHGSPRDPEATQLAWELLFPLAFFVTLALTSKTPNRRYTHVYIYIYTYFFYYYYIIIIIVIVIIIIIYSYYIFIYIYIHSVCNSILTCVHAQLRWPRNIVVSFVLIPGLKKLRRSAAREAVPVFRGLLPKP